ncbi:MAG: kynureninase [Proteobacteria bacterium]|nr:kynureninase [Pseudomonadota bacterium]
MDEADPLKAFRVRFDMPADKNGGKALYFCGNSLGAKPKNLSPALKEHLDIWAQRGVYGYQEWLPIYTRATKGLAALSGAKETEVVAMSTLSANLHHMMISFYNPTPERYKILYESNAFPSDSYVIASQIDMTGKKLTHFTGKKQSAFTRENAMIELRPRKGEATLRTEDIEKTIDEQGDSIALILIGGNNFYTGQTFDMERITKKGHEKGCVVGFDLAHSIGNVELKLHDWGVDFACWCSYKYLNSGPGAVAAIFIHERHHNNRDLPRLMGWWANRPETRFEMRQEIDAYTTAEAWQFSNVPVLTFLPLLASLDIFMEAGMKNILEKSRKLTGYMEFLLDSLETDKFKIITPRDPARRGAQLSIVVQENGKQVFDALAAAGVIGDWRNPDCIRLTPAPLYNSYEDVYKCVEIFAGALSSIKGGESAH